MADAFTVGLDGGEGNDTITNRGDIELLKAKAESDADSVAASVAVSVPIKGVSFVDVEGASLSNSSATAEAVVTGLDAGDGDDTVMSEGDIIKLEAEADADSLAVSVTIVGTVGGDAKGLALSEASATADATAAGISGGEGDDILENQAKIDATSTSVSEANSVSAEVSVEVAGGGECTGSALSDSSATSNAAATGIEGGEGNDEIDNEGELVTLADADADSLAVSVAIGVGSNGVFGGDLESEAASDASSTAEPRLSLEEMASLRQSFQQQMRVEQAAALRELAAENIIKSEEFLAKNKLKTGVVVLPSGVQYRIIDEGEGDRPNMDSTVMIHYRGSKMDEREFVSTFSTGTPEAVQINSEAVLPGWKDVLPLMKTGSSWQVFIPPELGFGERVNQNFGIGPNEALRFDIKLIEIVAADSIP